MKVMVCSARDRAYSFFETKLGLHYSDDFRGILFVPLHYQNAAAHMDHVAVAVGYNNFVGKICNICLVIQKPEYFTRDVIKACFEYPFQQAGVEIITAMVDSTNQRSIEVTRRSGFKQVLELKDGGLDGNMLMFTMSKSECKWLKDRHGQEKRTAST